MKNAFAVTSILLLTAISAAAQNTETIRVKAGKDIAEAVSAYGIYRLPAFTNGTVFFKDGKIGKEVLNYNILNDEMMYTTGKGDTLAIALPEEIKKIDISGVVFYYDKKGWLESIADAAPATLVVKRKITLHYEKEGAFGIPNATNGIDSYTTYTSNNSSYHLYVGEDATLKKLTTYFLRTRDGQLLPASKGNFLNQFAGNRKNIETYLGTTKINFNKEQDLIQLLGISSSGN